MAHRLAVLGALFVVSIPGAPAPASEGWDEEWRDVAGALEALEGGTREEKLALFPDAWWGGALAFVALDHPPDGDRATTDHAVERLRDYVATESDPWVLDRVAASLAVMPIAAATPIFADLSRHAAPSLRFRAIQHAGRLEDDESREILEPMWRDDHPPWLRAKLMDALTWADSEVHVEDCADLLDDPDDEVARAAIDCVERLGEPGALRHLLRVATGGSGARRLEALEALPWMVEDEPRLELKRAPLERMWRRGPEPWLEAALLRLLDTAGSDLVASIVEERIGEDDHPELALTAIDLVARSRDPGATRLLVERASYGAPLLRIAALESLVRQPFTPDIEQALLVSTDPLEPPEVRLAAIAVMERLSVVGHPSPGDRFERWLDGLAIADADPAVRDEAEQAASRLRGDLRSETTSCFLDLPSRFTLEPAAGTTSLRCHAEPGVEPDPAAALRIATGMRVQHTDYFDDGRSAWAAIHLGGGTLCWVPLDRLRRIAPWETIEQDAAESREEFDLPLSEIGSAAFLKLERARIVTVLDIGETLAGVRLTVDAEIEEEVELLRGVVEGEDTPLARAVRGRLPVEVDPGD